MHLIELKGVDLTFPHKVCFRQFSTVVQWGQRIAIVGENGAGKSSLLRMLLGELQPSEGSVAIAPDSKIGYVAQIQDEEGGLSGGQRVNRALSRAIADAPDLLLLDEPTNHLDAGNRRSLSRMLQNYYGTIVMVTHDHELMNQTCDLLWHIGHEHVDVFEGRYADYLAEQELKRGALEKQMAAIKRAKLDSHDALMQEQERAAHARQRGIKSIQDRKWATVKSPTKLGRGNTTAGRKQSEIREEQRELAEQLASLRPPEIITPRFHLDGGARSRQSVLQIGDGAVGYDGEPLLSGIHLTMMHGDRVALVGRNGSGKSTLARAILGDERLRLHGDWITPAKDKMGYVDQHYDNLDPNATVLETLARVVPEWSMADLRTHLASFLFRQTASVEAPTSTLSGGEKARLSLACIAADPPHLLILDELTNNLDTTMRGHMIEVLAAYPGAMLLISHDEAFLDAVGRVERYECEPVQDQALLRTRAGS
ncbi:ABC transporter ATP-binding protein [Trinickia dabaoshanensis]|uniref:ABC transporter ATP-binding protein n=1 Tax=Trinickia dabaoshanensis TaxID=564714 RepID=A0A2N7W0Z3_9BURK|nr:ABC-F family ATP-binding cassette domain-containing protein [Trinickia dabaoshanensis]PMS23062.1 ABC transporter ATP-binding protein [Trinickia dabaoshanensis]